MSQETLASFIASIQQTQNDFCQQLIREVRSSTLRNISEDQAHQTSFVVGANGNFAKCASRYGGRADESLDNFLDAVITYKDCVNVSDVNALRGFSMLLEGPAAVWWQGAYTYKTRLKIGWDF
uniref:SFRICE_026936 n=1 Tax=Spodoptera frugiperda TaxID=7108 RepID=A0A2H1VK17_SPOFR